MSEKINKKTSAKTGKKDMYSAVLISQIVAVIALMLTFNFTVKNNQDAYKELKILLSEEKFTMGDIITTVKEYFLSDSTWAVFGDNVSQVYDEKTENLVEETTYESVQEKEKEEASKNQEDDYDISVEEELITGTGGEDLELYQAAENTSFAPIRSTSPALSPIENGRYTSYFGYRINPITDEFSFHTGLDIATKEGTKIRAVYNGKVLRTGEDDRAGKYIFLEHDDGLVTFYCHCSEISAEVGAVIRQGETIAKVGSTGWSTGPHLHFELRKDNIRYNPLFILDYDSYC